MASDTQAAELPLESIESAKERKPVPKWAIHRRMYDWVMSWAHSKYSVPALFALSFAESSIFPIPPDVLQIALTLERRNRAFYYAFVTLVGSVLGALLGYLIGIAFWEATEDFFLWFVFSRTVFNAVMGLYQNWNFWIVFVAAFTPIPYKIITIAAGVFKINLFMFVIASIVGRAARFFLVGGLLYWFGESVRNFIDKYFNLLSIVFTVLLVGGFVLIKYVLH